MSNRKIISIIPSITILMLSLCGCNHKAETPYLTIEDTAVYNIGEPVQMDLNSEYEKLLMEKGFQTGTLPGTVEFSIDKVNIFDSPNEAGIIDLHGTCQDELKPSTDSKFLLLECTLKNVSAYTILENGNKQKYTSFSANHFEIATKEGDVFLSESGNSSGAARISRTRALGGDYYFDKCNPENIDTSNYYVISLDHGESITYHLGLYIDKTLLDEKLYYHYCNPGGGDVGQAPYFIQVN